MRLEPVAAYKWRWRIDTLDLIARRPHPFAAQLSSDRMGDGRDAPPPICLLLRFGSMFPWPVNILHHYILPPNPAFDMAAASKCVNLPYLSPRAADTQTPLHLRPYMVTSVASPVRMFTPTDAALGPYGTALWLDAQTDMSPVAQAGDRGQRIAGRVLRFVPRPEGVSVSALPEHAVDLMSTDAGTTAAVDSHPTEFMLGNGAERRGNSVFHVQEDRENWVRVAMCEEEGMIAVGSVDGDIKVYGYAPH